MITAPATLRRPSAAKRFATTLAIAATALGLLTAAAVPARADRQSDQIATFLAGIAALAIIAKSLDHQPRPHPVPQPQPQPPYYPPYDPPVVHQPVLPGVCALKIEGPSRDRLSYGERCLIDHGFRYPLPRHCARDVLIFGRRDRLYPAWCLEQAGFRTRPPHIK